MGLDVDGAEDAGRVRGDLRHRRILGTVHEVQKVEVVLDGLFHLPGLHVLVLPEERRNDRAVTPVHTVLVVPGQLFAGTRILDVRLFREGTAGHVAGQVVTGLGAQLGLAQIGLGGVDVGLGNGELGGCTHLHFEHAFLDQLVDACTEHVLELVGVGLVDDGAGRQPGKARHAGLVGVERILDIGFGCSLGHAHHAGRQQRHHGDQMLFHTMSPLLNQNL